MPAQWCKLAVIPFSRRFQRQIVSYVKHHLRGSVTPGRAPIAANVGENMLAFRTITLFIVLRYRPTVLTHFAVVSENKLCFSSARIAYKYVHLLNMKGHIQNSLLFIHFAQSERRSCAGSLPAWRHSRCAFCYFRAFVFFVRFFGFHRERFTFRCASLRLLRLSPVFICVRLFGFIPNKRSHQVNGSAR